MRTNRNEMPHDLQKRSKVGKLALIIAFHDEVTLVTYVPKKNRTVIALSTEEYDG
jgi:hypothetical protein